MQKHQLQKSVLVNFGRHTHYVSKVPESREAFDKALAAFYEERQAILAPPNIAHVPLDCYFIFRSVAERGGYEGASGTRYGVCLCFDVS